jgi:hypothetical protein
MQHSYDETILFARLLAGEPDATADLADAYLERLCATLRGQFSVLPPTLCSDDFAIDSILRLGKYPHRYLPKKGMSLFSYLVQDARGDLLNALAQERRKNSALSQSVEHLFSLRNTYWNDETEATVLANLTTDTAIEDSGRQRETFDLFLERAAPVIVWAYDKELLELIWREERKTTPYAQAMGIQDIPLQEQKAQVKKAKDRLKVALKRLGVLE